MHFLTDLLHHLIENLCHLLVSVVGIVALLLEESIAFWVAPSLCRSASSPWNWLRVSALMIYLLSELGQLSKLRDILQQILRYHGAGTSCLLIWGALRLVYTLLGMVVPCILEQYIAVLLHSGRRHGH